MIRLILPCLMRLSPSIPLFSLILKTVVAHPRALADPAPFVRMTELTDSSLHFTVRVWCKAEDFLDVKLDLTEQIKELFDQNGISIPYPQLDVHVKQ